MKKRNKMYIMIGLAVTILVLVGTSYAWWTLTVNQTKINEIQSSCLKLNLTEEQNDIHMEKAYPLTDKEAEELTPYSFTIENKCKTTVDYTVKLEKLKTKGSSETNVLDSKYVAVELNEGQKELLSSYPNGTSTYEGNDYTTIESKELIKGTLTGDEKRTYTLKLWMDESVTIEDEAENKSFVSKIVVDGSLNELAVYNEPKLHGTDPILKGELIAVEIDNEGKVTRANLAHEWYNYEEKRWANAVILTENAKEPEVGAIIPESDIESYFVWIPKYKYKIFDMGKYDKLLPEGEELIDKGPNTAIEIIFGNTDTTDSGKTNGESECASPKESGQDGQCEVGKWMTHPAFLAFPNTTGIWVGKFETGYKQGDLTQTTTSWNAGGAQKDANDSTKVIIKPNVYSWRSITVGNAFNTSLNYQKDLESHMMKNTEWGAVAYLTQSIYGRCDKETNTCTEVMINNSQSYVTGVSAKSTPTTGYNEYSDMTTTTPGTANEKSKVYPSSVEASTTKNNTGIFDMSGGTWEFVMGVKTDGTPNSNDKSGLTLSEIDAKYYDKYLNTKGTDFNKRILGDATGEMGPFQNKSYGNVGNRQIDSWYGDYGTFVTFDSSWFIRGGVFSLGTYAGCFNFYGISGDALEGYTFRIVLAP